MHLTLIFVFATYITLNVFPIHIGIKKKGVSVEQGCIIKYPPLLLSTATNCSLASSPHFEPTSTSLPFSWVLEEALDKVDLKIWHV